MSDAELLLAGDYPDPSIIRVGAIYYLTHSSFCYAPGLLIWQSTDLVNWTPLVHALPHGDGDVWAPDLMHHAGRFYIYYKTTGGNHAVHADAIDGPWSTPVDINVGYTDPGHVLDEHGKRHLHLSKGMMVSLADDGLSTLGEPRKVYEAWPMPDDWRVEGVCLESPKLLFREGWYHLLVAQGGTAGPATSHAVIHSRSRHVDGPWEHSPHNPIVHTWSADEPWWSRGHGTLIDTPAGDWWIVYHGYCRDFRTLGRQTLIAPVRWTRDGWIQPCDGDEARLQYDAMPARDRMSSQPVDDAFAGPALGWQWRFHGDSIKPHRFDEGLILEAAETDPDVSTLCCIPTDKSYEVEVTLETLNGDARAGLILFYDPLSFAGLYLAGGTLGYAERGQFFPPATVECVGSVQLKLVNRAHELDLWFRPAGEEWTYLKTLETSGYHHNMLGGFIALRVGLFGSGGGAARFRNFRYRSLPH